MGLRFRCQSCGADIIAPDKKPGQTVQCPQCANYNVIPPNAFEYSEAPFGVKTATEGVKRFAPKSFGDIFEETFKIYSTILGPIVGISALTVIPMMLLTFIILIPFYFVMGATGGEPSVSIASSIVLGFIILVVTLLGYSLMYGALVFAIGWHCLGRKINVIYSYKMAFKRIFQLIGASLLVPLVCGIMALTIIGIPFAIYFGINWMFYYQGVIFEMRSPVESMKKSFELVKGDWWLALGIALTFGLMTAAVSFILSFLPIIGSLIIMLLIVPIQFIAITIFYFERRGRKENYTSLNLEKEISALEAFEA